MTLRVLSPGLFTLVVDGGRPRTRSLGVPVGGAADRFSLAVGNALVGNEPDTAALEITLVGPTLVADVPLGVAVYGAPFERNGAFTLPAGEVLRLGGTASGARAYVCIAGGIDAPVILGSRTGLRPLAAGDALTVREGAARGRSVPGPEAIDVLRHVPAEQPPHPPSPPLRNGEGGAAGASIDAAPPRHGVARRVMEGGQSTPPRHRHSGGSPLSVSERGAGGVRWLLGAPGTWLRVLPGAHAGLFPDGGFCDAGYRISASADRMGVRLDGPPLPVPGELPSEPACPGAVQVTRDGQCIVLGVDGQTIGGYPKVAQVIAADLDDIGQLRPGLAVRFLEVTPEQARTAWAQRATVLRRWLTRLRVVG